MTPPPPPPPPYAQLYRFDDMLDRFNAPSAE
jgi:hypothetical protein